MASARHATNPTHETTVAMTRAIAKLRIDSSCLKRGSPALVDLFGRTDGRLATLPAVFNSHNATVMHEGRPDRGVMGAGKGANGMPVNSRSRSGHPASARTRAGGW
jgi:hypothetical protein